MKYRTILILLSILVLELGLFYLLQILGWNGTGSLFANLVAALTTLAPVLIGIGLLVRNRLRFSIRFLLVSVVLAAIFMALSAMPLVRFREARTGNLALKGLTQRTGEIEFEYWTDWCMKNGLTPPSSFMTTKSRPLPTWLQPFTKELAATPLDVEVTRIALNNDDQVKLFAKYHNRFPHLLVVSISGAISKDSFTRLHGIIAESKSIKYLTLNEGVIAPDGWFRSFRNLRSIGLNNSGANIPFPTDCLEDIVTLANLEYIGVNGYAFSDADASVLASSQNVKLIHLSRTAVTETGETELIHSSPGRRVTRD